jgi:hypothetical protein
VVQVAEHLLSKLKALGLNPNTAHNKNLKPSAFLEKMTFEIYF